MSKPKATGASDAEIAALLKRYRCPVDFHEVRTRFLGTIASPAARVSPMETVTGLWGGALPEFNDLDAVNALFGALMMGLWNRLTEHQNSRSPFRLVALAVPPTREGVARIALIRRQEIDGFVVGLFGSAPSMDLPERAHDALNVLSEARAIIAGMVTLLEDPTKPATPDDLTATLRNIQELSRIVEREIHKAVVSCARARGQLTGQSPPAGARLH